MHLLATWKLILWLKNTAVQYLGVLRTSNLSAVWLARACNADTDTCLSQYQYVWHRYRTVHRYQRGLLEISRELVLICSIGSCSRARSPTILTSR